MLKFVGALPNMEGRGECSLIPPRYPRLDPSPFFNFAWVPKKIGKTQVHPSGPEAYTRVDPGLLMETPTYVLVKIPKVPLRDFRPQRGGGGGGGCAGSIFNVAPPLPPAILDPPLRCRNKSV